ncbi:MAG: CRISPR-associated endoribonuclease Cas6 [Bacteroidota bacterium]
MRIILKLSPNKRHCPFDYQESLVKRFHTWIGHNKIHDELSLYSLSWLNYGKKAGKGLEFRNGSQWFISSWDESLIKKVVQGIQNDPQVAFGMEVEEVQFQETPTFSQSERFWVASPVFIKRTIGQEEKFYYYTDQQSEELLTSTLRNKMKKANINGLSRVAFDTSYTASKTKRITYKGINRKASTCPVIVEGTPEAIRFAWNVGVGNGTGIGFGALI